MSKVWLNYVKACIFIGSSLSLALLTSWVVRTKLEWMLGARIHALLTLISTILLALAGFGKLGWSIQTIGGTTPREHLNEKLFRVLSYVGLFLLFFEWWLKCPKN